MAAGNSKTDHELLPEVLVEQITKGQAQAEQELVSRYWRGLYFILNRRTSNPALAQDLAQETFIVVINKARNGEINNPSALSAFIRQVGTNLLIAHFRKEKRRATDSSADFEMEIPDDSPDFYRILQSEEINQTVRQLIEEMKVDRDREILRRHYIYEQEKSEICNLLELSPEHFDRVLHRARGRLKQIILHHLGSESMVALSANIAVLIVLASIVSSTDSAPVMKVFIF